MNTKMVLTFSGVVRSGGQLNVGKTSLYEKKKMSKQKKVRTTVFRPPERFQFQSKIGKTFINKNIPANKYQNGPHALSGRAVYEYQINIGETYDIICRKRKTVHTFPDGEGGTHPKPGKQAAADNKKDNAAATNRKHVAHTHPHPHPHPPTYTAVVGQHVAVVFITQQ